MPLNLTVKLLPSPVGMTYGDMIAYFADRFDEDNAHIKLVFQEVLNEIISRHDWRWLHESATLTTIANLAHYTLDENVQMVMSDMTIASTNSIVQRKSLEVLRRFSALASENTVPSIYAVSLDINQVTFWPTPDSAYEILYDYTKTVSDVIEEDVYPPLPRHFQHVMMSGVEEILRMDDDRLDGATNLARRKLEAQLLNMIWRETSADKEDMVPDVLPPSAAPR